MLRKIWAITWRDLVTNFGDRNLLLFMIAAPLALATIIGLAFGGASRGELAVPVVIVNQDQPVEQFGQSVAFGDTLVAALVPPADVTEAQQDANPLWKLIDATLLDDPALARSAVEQGEYAAAILIPADFSAQLQPESGATQLGPATLELFADPAAPTSLNIVRSVVENITTQFATGNITVAATMNALQQRAASDPAFAAQLAQASASNTFQPDFSAAFQAQDTIEIEQQSLGGEAADVNLFVVFGSSQAIFFMMFLAMGSANSLLYQKRDGTLGRVMTSPTPRSAILAGSLLGTILSCAAQVILLLVALTVMNGLVSGEFRLIFGSNLLALLATTLAVALAASGLGSLVMALSRTPEQGNVIGSIISIAFGIVGGGLAGAIDQFALASRLTINYWGADAFMRLSQGNNAIMTHLLVLLLIGSITLGLGFFLFSRRMEV